MKFCMIGCGGHATTAHGPAQKECAARYLDFELAACCDRDEHRASDYAHKFGFRRQYDDIDKMIAAEKPDALCLVLPTQFMTDAAAPLLLRGIPLLMEKPPGMAGLELNRLIAASERGRGFHQVGFNRRYMPAMVRLRELLGNTLNPDEILQMDYSLLRNARTDPDFSTTAIHAFDAALFLARTPYRQAAFSYRELPKLGQGVVQTTIVAEFVSGARIHFDVCPVSGINAETLAVHGVGHSFFVDIQNKSYGQWSESREIISATIQKDATLASLGFLEETEAFYQALKMGKSGSPTLADALQPVELMEAMRTRRATLSW